MRFRDQIFRPPQEWPISVKVPVVVALLMVIVGAIMTDQVLRSFSRAQEKHLRELAGAYLDGLSAALSPHVLRQDTWEIFDVLERSTQGYRGLDLLWTTVATADGAVLASSNPALFKVDGRLPEPVLRRFSAGADLVMSEADGQAHLGRVLTYQGRTIGGVYADVSIKRLAEERSAILMSLILSNALVTFALAGAGYLAVRRMMSPIRTLAYYLGRGRSGSPELIPETHGLTPKSEFGRLFSSYNRMATAIHEREEMAVRLSEEEKLGSLGRLTSALAHEINNPLGGLFNALDALKRHGDKPQVRTTSLGLLQRGLEGIRDVVRSALHVYRISPTHRILTPSDIEDIKLLIKPEVKRRKVRLQWDNEIDRDLSVPAAAVRDISLNLLLNACTVTPEGRSIAFHARILDGDIVIAVRDEGGGMPERIKVYLERKDSGAAPIEDRAGLGLWMIRRLTDEIGGSIQIDVRPAEGTTIILTLPISHEEAGRHVA